MKNFNMNFSGTTRRGKKVTLKPNFDFNATLEYDGVKTHYLINPDYKDDFLQWVANLDDFVTRNGGQYDISFEF